MSGFTVEVTLMGRHDRKPVGRTRETRRIGNFKTKSAAEVARQSWLADPTFDWSAIVVRGKGDGPAPSTHKRRKSTPRTFVWRGKRRPLGAPHAR